MFMPLFSNLSRLIAQLVSSVTVWLRQCEQMILRARGTVSPSLHSFYLNAFLYPSSVHM
ncbi:hypothetical protein B0H19DRAFT_1172585 [Mycena capillaripes]|nr:hypothetical protein B0H19DRAFT_1172585 [Mycena capillaripes]